ncbi:hypothetical protein FACS1894133_2420 [Clostridia bacterium]|nr:hypothetical protein FACS1894133_2420 [Clostridia bacterium]
MSLDFADETKPDITAEKTDVKEQQTINPRNFRITDDSLGVGGQKAKYANNIAAIRTLKLIESENRNATTDEQETLSRFVGWGGIPQVFDPRKNDWDKEYNELRELLTPGEYANAAASTLNAHYTSPIVIKSMYEAIEQMGFESGRVLEPACGIGNFFGLLPESMRYSKLYGVELDGITGRIVKLLYPNADIQVKGFEKTNFQDNSFDVAIGNVPFGSYGVSDPKYNNHNFLIHDYFFAKTIDKVKPGGIVAFVTSKGTLDKNNQKLREYIAKKSDLIGAVRLPNNAFKANANTEVTTDIIFLKKREYPPTAMPDWVYTAKNADGIPLNNYFHDHPEMILGTMAFDNRLYGNNSETTCIPLDGADLSKQLSAAIANLNATFSAEKSKTKELQSEGIIEANANVRNFTHTLINGKLFYRENDLMTEVKFKGKNAAKNEAHLKALHNLRLQMREIISAQLDSCSDDKLAEMQKKLSDSYDSFTARFGYVSDKTSMKLFGEDDDCNLLYTIENINPETKDVTKADIFSKRTIRAETEITHVDTTDEAMQVSLDRKGKIDLEYMARLCGETAEAITADLVQRDVIFLNPATEKYVETSEYLSGNVRDKLKVAELFVTDNPDLERNVTALKAVIPKTIEASEISARISSNWVDTEDYAAFLREYASADLSPDGLRRTSAGEYKIENKKRDTSVAATSTYGTKRMSSYAIFENLLNKRDMIVRDRVVENDKERYIVNKKETQFASEKARQMSEAFPNWLWKNSERREKYVLKYNELFNSIVGREYDGSHQSFPGMTPFIKLHEHQKNAIARAKYGGNTLLAHVVGAGKSFEIVASVMEKKRLGLINKAVVVVPKSLTGQTAIEWQKLYPNAKLLVAGEKDFEKNKRQRFISKCVTGDYDGIVMSYEQFEKIPMSQEYQQKFMYDELNHIMDAIEELDRGDRVTIKDLERQKRRIEAKLEKLLNSASKSKAKDTQLTFEEMGVDYVVVDEAHTFKNAMVVSKMKNVAGVGSGGNNRTEDMLMKCNYINETYGYKNILFATGTPITNSMSELYSMTRYLRPDLLEQSGLHNFDDWASEFGDVVSQMEMRPAGNGFRIKKRFAKFTNLPELMAMYKEFADVKNAEDLNLPTPKLETGKPQIITAQINEAQKKHMEQLVMRSEALQQGSFDPRIDNMLKITGEARLLGLDARCIDPDAENYPDSKVNKCIDNAARIYERTTEQSGVQAIFCDLAIHSDGGRFSVYDYIKEELIKRGIPENEICFAGDAKNLGERNEMFAQLRSGEKRVIIGSTSKCGTGANI